MILATTASQPVKKASQKAADLASGIYPIK